MDVSPASILPRCYSVHTIFLVREFLGEVGGLCESRLGCSFQGASTSIAVGTVDRVEGKSADISQGPAKGSLPVNGADDMLGFVVDDDIVVAKVPVGKGEMGRGRGQRASWLASWLIEPGNDDTEGMTLLVNGPVASHSFSCVVSESGVLRQCLEELGRRVE